MESQKPTEGSHEDLTDQPTEETSKPKTTSDEPALDSDQLADKYMDDSDEERG